MPRGSATPKRKRIALAIAPLAVPTGTAALMVGLSRSTFYSAWSAGKTPKGVPFGRRRLFPVAELKRWVELGMPPREKFEQLKQQSGE